MYRHEQVLTNKIPVKLVVHTKNIEAQTVLRHWHLAVEIDYIVDGAAKFVVSGEEIIVQSGDLVVINSNEIHSVQPLGVKQNTLSLTFLLPYEFLKKEISQLDGLWLISPNSKEKTIVEKHLYQYFKDTKLSKNKNLFLKRDIYQILLDLVNYLATKRQNRPNIVTPPILNKLSKVITFIDQHSNEKLSVSKIAHNVHLSEGYLSRVFKKQMGTSIMKYVNLVRLIKAFEMLTNTNKTIDSISDLVGFPNPKAFRMLFQKSYQKTPGKYRLDLKRSVID